MKIELSTLAAPDFVIVSSPRSGTHFLETALASHPKIHRRGECVLRFCRSLAPPNRYVFINKPRHLNGAIVMYAHDCDVCSDKAERGQLLKLDIRTVKVPWPEPAGIKMAARSRTSSTGSKPMHRKTPQSQLEWPASKANLPKLCQVSRVDPIDQTRTQDRTLLRTIF